MLPTDQVDRLRTHIEIELFSLQEWIEASEIKGIAKENMQLRQRRLEAAIMRMQRGVFGICCDCGDRLALSELEVDPAAPFCAYCQEERKTISNG